MVSNSQVLSTSHATAFTLLDSALLEVQQHLQEFAQANGFEANYLAPAFGTATDSERLQDLVSQFAQGNFGGLPAIAPRPSQDLNGAMGVYVAETNQIYLSESFLLNASQEHIVAVMLEEIGHSLDAQINPTDSAGDEGAIFSALVRGQSLSATQLAVLQAENDQATLFLDDQWVTVEQASLTVNIAAQNVVDGDTTDITSLLADPGADGLISLREAIAAANNTAGANTITFDQSGTILFDAVDNTTNGDNATPSILSEVTIDGDLDDDGIPDVTLDASQGPDKRVFHVALEATATMDGLIITGGTADPGIPFGSFFSSADGGAIYNNGTLTVRNAVITGNRALDDGGAITSYGNITDGAIVTIIDSTISGNEAGGNGGGLSNIAFTSPNPTAVNSAVVNVVNSTISGNKAGVGGGVSNFGQNEDNGGVMNVVNSTISGNEAVFGGGGIYNRGQTSLLGGTTNITNSTITQNAVTNPGSSAGGILSLHIGAGANIGQITVRNSIIAGNTATAHPDARQASATSSPIIDGGNNLIGIDSQGIFTTSTLVGSTATPLDPRLDALADNGGLTQTHGLLPDSPALNAGSDALATAANLTTDQRSLPRFAEQIDIGALEQQDSTVSLVASDATADENTPSDTATYTISRNYTIIEGLPIELGLTLGTDLSFSDFTLSGGNISVDTATNTAMLTIPARELSVDIILTPNDDITPEAAESLTLALVNTANYTVDTSSNSAIATIIANDPVPPTPPVVVTLTPTPTPPASPTDTTPPKGAIAPPPIRTRNTALDDIQITFDEAVTNFDLADVRLIRNGIVIALTRGTLTTADSITWTLEGLSSLTTEDGTYEVTLVDGSDITDASGNVLTPDTSITWQTGQTGTSRPDIDFSGGNKGKTSTGNDQGERIIGTPRNDVLKGGQGNDRIIAGFGKEWFGRDRLFGGGGNDVLKAGAGRDFLDGGAGRDRLFGGKNKDELTGGRGNDRLVGGSGSDILNGGVGDDIIIGGPGKDTIVFTALNEGIDTVKGFNPNQDLIDLSEIFKADIYAADNSFAQYINYVQLEQVGNATYVKVDADGSGTEFTTLAKLKGVQTDAISSRHFVME